MTMLARAGWPEAETTADESAFWADQARLGARHLQMLLLVGGVVSVLWYPTDAWFFAELPQARASFAAVRLHAAAVSFGAVLLVTFVPFLRRHALPVCAATGALVCLVVTGLLGDIGGPEEPWFHFTYMMVLVPLTMALRPWARVALTLGYAACLVCGYFVINGHPLTTPLAGASLSYLTFVTGLSVVAGFFTDGQRRRIFFSALQTRRQAEELAQLSASLEARVLERTAELQRTLRGVEAAREGERTRIARELHDEMGQEITGLSYALESAVMRAARGESTTTSLQALKHQVSRLQLSTRAIFTELRPMVLDDLGLAAALDWLVTRLRERSNLECRLSVVPAGFDLPAPLSTAVFRIVQESLVNVTRHACAARVEVDLRREEDALQLTVSDDGDGFDPSRVDTGFGLMGMRERVRALGGSLQIESAPGQGTVLRIVLPVETRELPAVGGLAEQ